MFRSCSRVIALTAMVASPTAQAAEPATLTLACQGTTTIIITEASKPEPISMGIIVDFTNHTVHGFGYPGSGRTCLLSGGKADIAVFGQHVLQK